MKLSGIPQVLSAAAIVTCGLIAGCAPELSSSRVAPSTVVVSDLAPPPVLAERGPEAFLVWGRESGPGSEKTYRIDARTGAVRGEEKGVTIAAARGEWRWDPQSIKVATLSCSDEGAGEQEAGEGTIVRAEVMLRDGGERAQVMPSSLRYSDSDTIDHSIELLASVGPYLFLKENLETSGCGPPTLDATFGTWDLDRAVPVALLDEVSTVARLQEEARDTCPEEGMSYGGRLPTLVLLMPSYSAEGRLRFDAQLAGYGLSCLGDVMWSTRTYSRIVPSRWSSDRFAAWATRPVAVTRFLAHRSGFEMGGWSSR